ncbi:hypothetical protein AGMMS49546_36480 [Spirochaetia bacterium]|nr:hypothetical protein AGMMS49546_36480 [Spirochaetia bacterium]
MKNPIDLKGFIQIAIVVKDIEKSAKAWADLFNIPVPEIQVQEQAPAGLMTRGKQAAFKRKKAIIDAGGDWKIELFQPTGGESTFQEFLDQHGEGVHYLGFDAGERRDAIVDELEAKGCALRILGPNKLWTVVDTEKDLGVCLNIKPNA